MSLDRPAPCLRVVPGGRPPLATGHWLRARLAGASVVAVVGTVAAALLASCGGRDHAGSAAAATAPLPIPVALTLGQLGEAPGRFAAPRAIDACDRFLWVVDRSARIQKIDPVTGECLAWFRTPQYELGKPVGITCGPGPDGRPLLYIADTHYHRILLYRPPENAPGGGLTRQIEPELVATIGGYGMEGGQFIYPTDVALLLSPDGRRMERMYVSEYGGNDRVSVFDERFEYQFSFGRFGFAEDDAAVEFQRPQSIAVDQESRTLYVVDSRNHRVGRFSLEGELLGWIGSTARSGRGLGELRYPYGLSLLGDGTAMVVEFGNNRVQRVDLSSGRGLAAWGRPGRGDGELAAPWAITVLGSRTYVLDTGNHRVVAFANPRRRG